MKDWNINQGVQALWVLFYMFLAAIWMLELNGVVIWVLISGFFLGGNHVIYSIISLYRYGSKSKYLWHSILSILTLLFMLNFNYRRLEHFWIIPALLALYFWYLTFFGKQKRSEL